MDINFSSNSCTFGHIFAYIDMMSKMGKVRKKKNIILLKIAIVIVLIVLLTIGFIAYIRGNIMPAILTMSEASVKVMAVNAINNAAHIVVDSEMSYEDFVIIQKDSNDKIQFVQANTIKINRLTRDLANLCQSNIEKIEHQSVQIPLGAFTGSVVLSDFGPQVNIALLPIGSVQCDFTSFFEQVGINQTRHSIYINIKTTISLVLPISSVPVNISTAILVCENVIVGEVPEFYFNGSGSYGKLHLSPS